jgi:hypothetical protein
MALQCGGGTMLNVFVAFPYRPEPLEGYRDIFRGIERHFSYANFVFADEHINSDVVLQSIRTKINDCNLCMCDITGWNANVCLELGLAMGLGKRVQLLFKRSKKGFFSRTELSDVDLPVDIRGHGRIEYTDGPSLHAALRSFIQQELRDPHPDVATQSFKLMCESVYALIEQQPGLKKFEIANRLFLQPANINSAIDELLREGRITREGRHANIVFYRAGYVPPPAAEGPHPETRGERKPTAEESKEQDRPRPRRDPDDGS